jgi:hypothetical protein
MASAFVVGLGLATTAFLVRPHVGVYCLRHHLEPYHILTNISQGRAGYVALQRYRGGVNKLGRAFYKGYV